MANLASPEYPPRHQSAPPATPTRSWRRRLTGIVDGPLPRLPAGLDHLAEAWWRLPPRVRVLGCLLLVVGVTAGLAARATSSPWGPAVVVQVATANAQPGEAISASADRWPADLVPEDALAGPPEGVATRTVRPGEVLTHDHVATNLSHLLGAGEVAITLDGPSPRLPAGVPLELLGTDFQGRGRRLGHGRLLAVDDEMTWVAIDRSVAPAVAAAMSTGQVTVAVASSQ